MDRDEYLRFSDDLAAMVRDAARPLIAAGALLEEQRTALRAAIEPLASGVVKTWLQDQRAYFHGVSAGIEALAEHSRFLSSQLQIALPTALEYRGHLLSVPALGTMFDFTLRITDDELAAMSVDLAKRGWLLYPVIADAPYSDVVEFTESFSGLDDDDVDSWMTRLTEYALRGMRRGDRGRLTTELGEHLLLLDPALGAERFRYFREARRAFILGGLDAAVPPLLLTQGEGVARKASGLLTGVRGWNKSFYEKNRVRIFVEALQRQLDSEAFYGVHDDVLLPLLFKRQFEALNTVLTQSSMPPLGDSELLNRRGRPVLVPVSRHHIGHGGVGFGHRTVAAKAIVQYAGLVTLLGQLATFKRAMSFPQA